MAWSTGVSRRRLRKTAKASVSGLAIRTEVAAFVQCLTQRKFRSKLLVRRRCVMRRRTIAWLVGGIAISVLALIVSVAGQTSTTAGQTGSALKTPWGEPNLQGIWTREYDVPLQRPPKYKDLEFFTKEQIAELDNVRAARPGNETRSVRGTEQDLAGAYNSVYLTRRHSGRRTS